MPNPSSIMPAEWEPHDATWLGWPSNPDDWPGKLEAAEWGVAEIVRLIAAGPDAPRLGERVEVLCANERTRDRAAECLRAAGADMDFVSLHVLITDRVWLRDSGPTFVRTPAGSLELLDWRFNAWAKYDNWRYDDLVPRFVEQRTRLPRSVPLRPDNEQPLVMEGGAIEVDGDGLILVTEECLLDQRTQCRNPGLSREHYERAFARYLGATRTIWLAAGCDADDTHGHIDDVARFVPRINSAPTAILAYEEDPSDPNHKSSLANERRLAEAGVHVVTIPYPAPIYHDDLRLPASYANFYIANAAVLVPTFNDPNDRVVLDTIAGLFPDRPVVGVHARDLVLGLGTLHCLTQQQPVGLSK